MTTTMADYEKLHRRIELAAAIESEDKFVAALIPAVELLKRQITEKADCVQKLEDLIARSQIQRASLAAKLAAAEEGEPCQPD